MTILQQEPLKIHLGCGHRYMPGWLNVDGYPWPEDRVDVVQDIRQFTCAEGRASEVLAVHVLEHLHRAEVVTLTGRAWHWLQPGGRLVVEMPERTRCVRAARDKSPKQQLTGIKGLLGGRHNDKAEWHRWLMEQRPELLRRIEAGESVADMIPEKFGGIGQAHLYVWDADEFADVLRSAGFVVAIADPQHHGGRKNRDCRWEATKPQ